ncbi:xanthine dehydrogenase family protein molybdopterin-binding subunit [Ancylobacter sp. MQZ15Z-1]|uniref:Xanthine dehydrogenase family protein molybdopterin-binding subunit n=1 Tax=Ancylobacter mangrovi TaxID=2972472 RepID=A0A9X2PI18_9HYPH|nr:xanthine dehydrogenase family protein molybdopterin-binding subunit [Ancylobacter mangrovi]MCS0496563.1 xanthine dehydrogenase family protein molybdopterin-binding subunit [Ancylobacter mangrovi]
MTAEPRPAADPAPHTFGRPVARVEDDALLRGRARFVDDIHLPGLLEAAFVRSPHAHARIRSIDCEPARAAPGVVAVMTFDDLRDVLTSDRLVVAMPSPSYLLEVHRPILARHETVHVGEAIAVVIAASRYLAEDAAALVEVDYDPLPVVADCHAALAEGGARVHADLPHNVVAELDTAYGDVDAAFAGAAEVVEDRFWLHRGGSHSMECRGVVASLDPLEDRLTVWSSTQTPNVAQRLLCDLLARDSDAIRVVTPELGGGFGPKLVFYPEEAVVAASAVKLGRPVKWIEDRREHFVVTTQERDQHWEMAMALDAEGRVLGMRGSLLHDHGAYTARGTNVVFASAITVPLAYNVPAYRLASKLLLTNKVPVTPIRGAGQPQAAFVMERLLDQAARRLGLDRAEIRRRNLVQPEQMPCRKPMKLRGGTFVVLDSGDYPAAQRLVMEKAGWDDFPRRQAEARAQGRHIGLGLVNYVEGTGRGPFEPVRVRVAANGRIHVASSATAMGQGTKTMLAQVVAEQLGGAIENVVVTTGDTAAMTLGFGGFNSRQAVMAGSSAHAAAVKVRAKALEAAAHMLEARPDELTIVGTHIRMRGNNRTIGLGEVARALEGIAGYVLPGNLEPGLEATEQVIVHDMAFSNGSAVAEVEVDVETGHVQVLRYLLAHDCGQMINPMLVDGQVIGGIAHGIGNALFEWMGFDANAQPLTNNYGEYLLVTAPEMPSIELFHRESPSPLNTLGIKGVGESGVIPTPAVIASAVEDALQPFGVRISHAPLSPMDILDLIARADGA